MKKTGQKQGFGWIRAISSGLSLWLVGLPVAQASQCVADYEDRIARLEKIRIPGKWTILNGGSGLVLTQTALALGGATTVVGLATAGGSLVGATSVYLWATGRQRSLDRVLQTYLDAREDRLESLTHLQKSLAKRYGESVDRIELGYRVRAAMENGLLCGPKPVGYSQFLQIIHANPLAGA